MHKEMQAALLQATEGIKLALEMRLLSSQWKEALAFKVVSEFRAICVVLSLL